MNAPFPNPASSQPETLAEWLAWLERPRCNQIKLGLSRMFDAANALHCRIFSCPVILVAGTNGKGTTVQSLSAIYQQAGYQVGSYFSPHLLCFNERIQVNGKPISDSALSACFAKVHQYCKDEETSYFEYTTLAALLYFSEQQLDLIILEVGLGGRLDATNIVDPSLSIITTVDFDHQAILGSSLEAIGREKAGIMRAGRPCVLSSADMPKTVYQQAKQLGTTLVQFERNYQIIRLADGKAFYQDGQGRITLHPNYQPEMQAGAVAAVRVLQDLLPLDNTAVEAGLESMQLWGRQTWLNLENGWKICADVAHNSQSVRYLAEKLAGRGWRGHILFSCLSDKDYASMIKVLLPYAKSWYIFPLSSPRALMPDIIAQEIQKQDADAKLQIHSSAEQVLAAVFSQQAPDELLICGSFHTVGEGLTVLKQHYRAQ